MVKSHFSCWVLLLVSSLTKGEKDLLEVVFSSLPVLHPHQEVFRSVERILCTSLSFDPTPQLACSGPHLCYCDSVLAVGLRVVPETCPVCCRTPQQGDQGLVGSQPTEGLATWHQNTGEVGSTCFVSTQAKLPSELSCSFRLRSVGGRLSE